MSDSGKDFESETRRSIPTLSGSREIVGLDTGTVDRGSGIACIRTSATDRDQVS